MFHSMSSGAPGASTDAGWLDSNFREAAAPFRPRWT